MPQRRPYRYRVDIRPDARAGLDALAPAPRQAAWHLIRDLQADPYRAGTKQLENQPDGTRRAVLGGRRLIYSVNQDSRTIAVERIDLRAIVYAGRFSRRRPP